MWTQTSLRYRKPRSSCLYGIRPSANGQGHSNAGEAEILHTRVVKNLIALGSGLCVVEEPGLDVPVTILMPCDFAQIISSSEMLSL